MRRNRKKTKANGFVFPVPFAGMVIIFAALGIVYVWLGCRCESLGREIKTLENDKVRLHKKYLNEEIRWTRMKSPLNIERKLKKHGIVMAWPKSTRVVHLRSSDSYCDETVETLDDARQYIAMAKLERVAMYE